VAFATYPSDQSAVPALDTPLSRRTTS
jgi:hypothetical protein